MEKWPEDLINQAPHEHTSRRKHKHGGGGDEGEGLWAVSYADLLMVLMSFFIVFFKIEDAPEYNINELEQVIFAFKNDLGLSYEKSIATDSQIDVIEKKKQERLLAGFSDEEVESIKTCGPENQLCNQKSDLSFNLINSQKESANMMSSPLGIMVDLSNDLFGIGEYQLSEKALKELDLILERISPYQEKLNLVFIGHSDSIPMGANKKVIDSNLILSTLRASKAVEHTLKKGFSPAWVSAQGVAEHNRNSRTLSLRIMQR